MGKLKINEVMSLAFCHAKFTALIIFLIGLIPESWLQSLYWVLLILAGFGVVRDTISVYMGVRQNVFWVIQSMTIIYMVAMLVGVMIRHVFIAGGGGS